MTDYSDAGFSQQTETRPEILNGSNYASSVYGRNYADPGVPIIRARVRKVPPPKADIFKRPVYLCPELRQTCHREGAYDAFELPSIIGEERRPYRFSRERTHGL